MNATATARRLWYPAGNPACSADPSHQAHVHDVEVVLSGTAYGAIEGGGLLQTERPWIADELLRRKAGFGTQHVGTLTREDAEDLEETLQAYGEMLSDRSAFDPGDDETNREGRACLRDAKRLRATLAAS